MQRPARLHDVDRERARRLVDVLALAAARSQAARRGERREHRDPRLPRARPPLHGREHTMPLGAASRPDAGLVGNRMPHCVVFAEGALDPVVPSHTLSEGAALVRSVADRAFLPTKNMLEEVGNMMILTGKTIVSAIRPPYPYGGEFVSQFLFALKLCWFPLMVSTVAFGYGAPGLQAANFLVLFGAIDRLGGFFVLASIREFAPFVDAIVLAGVAGTAITADLGARKIREELDALQVLGVDPVKNLVVPRFLALMLVTGLFDVYALLFGVFGGILATLVNGAPLGPFWATFFTNASTTDLWGSILKTTLFGAIIAIVCCYKGMTASGGAEGVGRAVNQAVVIAFLGVFAFNYVFTQTLLATHPEITVIR
jgi:phospholipid/cholesterol/gamma-HCH transport system permease protein